MVEKLSESMMEEKILQEIKDDIEWVMVESPKLKKREKIVKWDIDGAIARLQKMRRQLEVK